MTRGADTSPAPSARRSGGSGSRAFGLGSRPAALGGVAFALLALAVALLAALRSDDGRRTPSTPTAAHHGAVVRGTNTAAGTRDRVSAASLAVSTEPSSKYGGLPAWLPKAKAPVGRVLHASPAHPALTIQGEAVSVDFGRATMLVTAAGPSVPQEGRTPVPETSPCTFVVTFAHTSRAIAIDPAQFALVDEQGHVRHPSVRAIGGGAAPSRIPAGKTLSLTVKHVLPTGDGALTWTPSGRRPIASWDFDVEID
jgi:hypothetical protein